MFLHQKEFSNSIRAIRSKIFVDAHHSDKYDRCYCFITQFNQYNSGQFSCLNFVSTFHIYINDVATRIKTQRRLLRTWLFPTVRAYTAHSLSVWICTDVCVCGKCCEKKMWKILPLKDRENESFSTHCQCCCVML